DVPRAVELVAARNREALLSLCALIASRHRRHARLAAARRARRIVDGGRLTAVEAAAVGRVVDARERHRTTDRALLILDRRRPGRTLVHAVGHARERV